MKKISFKNLDYNCPQTWEEVTLQMVIDLHELNEIMPDSPLISLISAYTKIPIKDLITAKKEEVDDILECLDFVYEEYKPEITNEFEFQGETYMAEEDIVNQSFGDYVSIQTILFNYKENPEKGLPRMLAVYCKKEGETIENLDLNERSKMFLDLPITKAKNIEGFFLSSLNASKIITQLFLTIPDMEKYIQEQVKELKIILKQRKAESGGFSHTRLLIGYYQMYLWYFEHLLVKFFNSGLTKHSKLNWIQIFKKSVLNKVGRKSK